VAEEFDVSGAIDPFDRKKRPNLPVGWLVDRWTLTGGAVRGVWIASRVPSGI
jgi:hypothetical protein